MVAAGAMTTRQVQALCLGMMTVVHRAQEEGDSPAESLDVVFGMVAEVANAVRFPAMTAIEMVGAWNRLAHLQVDDDQVFDVDLMAGRITLSPRIDDWQCFLAAAMAHCRRYFGDETWREDAERSTPEGQQATVKRYLDGLRFPPEGG